MFYGYGEDNIISPVLMTTGAVLLPRDPNAPNSIEFESVLRMPLAGARLLPVA